MSLPFNRPAASLLAELKEVARTSGELAGYLRHSNTVGDSFPKASLIELCQSLDELQHGSAEGSRVPLEYARARIPAIRREYVVIEGAETGDGDLQIRGGALDRNLSAVISAVATALDEYRRLASDRIVADVIAPSEILPADSDVVVAANQKSIRVETSLRASREEATNLVESGSDRGENLGRVLQDAINTNKLARLESQQHRVVVHWLQTLVTKLKDYPSIIHGVGRIIVIGTDVTRTLVHRWDALWAKLQNVVFDEIRDAGESLERVAVSLKNRREGKLLPASAFPDKPTAPQVSEAQEFQQAITDYLNSNGDSSFKTVCKFVSSKYKQIPRDKAKSLGFRNISSAVNAIDGLKIVTDAQGIPRVVQMTNQDFENLITDSYARVRKETAEYLLARFLGGGEVDGASVVEHVRRVCPAEYFAARGHAFGPFRDVIQTFDVVPIRREEGGRLYVYIGPDGRDEIIKAFKIDPSEVVNWRA